jgi:hypothetical protein
MPPVFRFAPSPNGLLHLGHAYSALINFDSARRRGGLSRERRLNASRCTRFHGCRRDRRRRNLAVRVLESKKSADH